jgi:hypothetical protein
MVARTTGSGLLAEGIRLAIVRAGHHTQPDISSRAGTPMSLYDILLLVFAVVILFIGGRIWRGWKIKAKK